MQGEVTVKYKNEIIHRMNDNGAFRLPTYKSYVEDNFDIDVNLSPVIEQKEITSNGTYIPEEGVDGFAPVNVNVPNTYTQEEIGRVVTDSTTLTPQSSVTITENNTYDTTLNNQELDENDDLFLNNGKMELY